MFFAVVREQKEHITFDDSTHSCLSVDDKDDDALKEITTSPFKGD